MRTATAEVREWRLADVEGDSGLFNAASLGKQIIGDLALQVIDDLDAPIWNGITARHVLSHTTGLPNWRVVGGALELLRPPGQRWGYSGEGFVLLQAAIERAAGRAIQELAEELVFAPLHITASRLDEPEPGYHGHRPMITTAADYGRFLAYALGQDDQRWQVQVGIDDQLAWGAGWGLETGPPLLGWQWGQNPDAAHFVMGCPSTGEGVVVFTDDADHGRDFYRDVVERVMPGSHPSLVVEHNPVWLNLMQ